MVDTIKHSIGQAGRSDRTDTLDLVFSIDSVITAVGIAAMVVAIGVMMLAANAISDFVQAHPSTRMLALAFLLMIGMALLADGAITISNAASSMPRWPLAARPRC